MDQLLVKIHAKFAANRWLAFRLDFLATLLTLFSSVLAIYNRSEMSLGLAALSISLTFRVTLVVVLSKFIIFFLTFFFFFRYLKFLYDSVKAQKI